MLDWMVLPYIDLGAIGSDDPNRPVFRATTTCPDPMPFVVGGIVVGAVVVYLLTRK